MANEIKNRQNSKLYNTANVVRYIKENGKCTVSDISRTIPVSLATAYRILHMLLEDGLVIPSEKISSKNGRQPILYTINPQYAHAVCILLEKTVIDVCISRLDGRIIQHEAIQINSKWEKEGVLQQIHNSIQALVQRQWGYDAFAEKIKSIHIAVEADVDRATGRIIAFSGADCFDDFDITTYFEEKYTVPVQLKKLLDVEAVTCIHQYFRYNFENYIYLHIGVGFGASVVIDRKIYKGANGKAGELVRLRDANGRTWEEAYGTNNLYQQLLKIAAAKPESQINSILMETLGSQSALGGNPFMHVLDKALDAKCPEGVSMLSEAANGWADAINMLNIFFDPEVIVIGGDITSDMPNVFNLLRQILVKKNHFNGRILPAQYQTSLIDEVSKDAIESLYKYVDDRLAFVN